MRVAHKKLVRDRIPEIIQSEGRRPITRVLNHRAYREALLAKLLEEAQEAQAASAQDLPHELADILEVLYALAKTQNVTRDDLLSAADRKRAQSGGFDGRIFLEYVEQSH